MNYNEIISSLERYFEGNDLKRGDALRIEDAIKDLIKEIDSNCWVKTEDKKPTIEDDFGQTVVIVNVEGHKKYGDFVFPAVCSKVKLGDFVNYSWWMLGYDKETGDIPYGCVTHWSELPKPPGEGEKKVIDMYPKELIKKLRKKDGYNCECLQAADYIEEILDRQNEMLKDLKKYGSCSICAHSCSYNGGVPCAYSGDCNNKEHWKWRGQ